MTLRDALAEVAKTGPAYTVELMEYDGHERLPQDFERSVEGMHLLDVDADLTWLPGSHWHEGERIGEIHLHLPPDAQTKHDTIVIRHHTDKQ
jgi:hypothetical protein